MPGGLTVVIILLAVAVAVLLLVTVNVLRRTAQPRERRQRTRDQATILKEAQRRLAQNPRDTGALADLADVYFKTNEWEKAAKTYRTLMDAAPMHPDDVDEFTATLRFGIASVHLKRYQDAYKALVVARSMNADVFEVNHHLGIIEYRRKVFDKALVLLRKANVLQPNHQETERYLALTLARNKKHEEALPILKRVLDQHPDDREAMFVQAQCYHEQGQVEMALRIFMHLRPDPVYGPHASLMSGTLHAKQKRYDDAKADLEIGLRHPEIRREIRLEMRYRLASMHVQVGELTEALRLLNEIESEQPGYKDVPTQIQRYGELHKNENLQTYLLAPKEEFVALCKRMAANFIPQSKTKVTKQSVYKSEYADLLAEVETASWQDLILFRFMRTEGQVGELALREFQSRLKDERAGRGYCVSAGTFSETAQAFVEARLIDLIDKPQLVKMLARAG